MKSLSGGSGQSWRVGNAVLKPCDDPVEWCWIAEYFPKIKQDGFRLALPLCDRNGNLVVDGWCAQVAVEGDHPKTARWKDVIAVGNLFHKAITSNCASSCS